MGSVGTHYLMMCPSLSMTEQKSGVQEKSTLNETMKAYATKNSKRICLRFLLEQGEF